jgi:hypothetical protein
MPPTITFEQATGCGISMLKAGRRRQRIAIEKLVPPAEDENSGNQKDDHGESESDAQRRNSCLFNHRYH